MLHSLHRPFHVTCPVALRFNGVCPMASPSLYLLPKEAPDLAHASKPSGGAVMVHVNAQVSGPIMDAIALDPI